MPLGINTNLSAQGIIKNLEASQAQFSKSVTRLSTGLRINSAADDPAGLIQAQKYQSQVNGLGQAISNARDAINLVQTAEGAMDQISSQLQSMRTLALHAANSGVNDSTAQAADQAQISLALESIDRIVSNTQFGNKRLLDGSAGITGTASSSDVSFQTASAATKAGTYSVQITAAAVQGQAQGAALKQAAVTGAGGALGDTASAGATLRVQTDAAGDVSAADVTLDIGGMTLDQVVSTINGDSRLAGKAVASKSDDGFNLIVKTAEITATATGSEDDALQVTLTDGTSDQFGLNDGLVNATSTGGVANDGQSLTQADSSARLKLDQSLTFANTATAKSVAVTLKAGTTLSAAVSQINSAVQNAEIAVTASLSADGRFQVTNNDYGSAASVENLVTDNLGGVATNNLRFAGAGTATNIASGVGFTASTAGVDVAGSINGHAGTGNGQVLTGADSQDEEGLAIKFGASTVPAGNNAGTVTVANNSLTMQVGAFAGQTATVGVSSLATVDLGKDATGTTLLSGTSVKLSNIDVSAGTDGAGAADALRVIDAAISQVASLRADLGAFQTQTLESTVKSSQVAQSNLTTTLSDIQDANMAQESTAFSRAQILQQQSVSMLAQANQSSQLLLRLFQ